MTPGSVTVRGSQNEDGFADTEPEKVFFNEAALALILAVVALAVYTRFGVYFP